MTWLTWRVEPATWLTRQDPVATCYLLFFLLKRRRFDFLKIDSIKTRNPDIRLNRVLKL